ncbi:MAG: MASE1 domain-containing protein, partial [Gemmatimonadaceae bacterium]
MDSSAIPRDDRPPICPPRWDARIAGGLFLGWITLAHTSALLELSPAISAWYPPAALLAAACMLWGARALVPIVLAACTLAVWSADRTTGLARVLAVSALIKVIYWSFARTLRARDFDLSFSRPADVTRFGAVFLVAAGVAGAVVTVDTQGLSGVLRPYGLLALRTFWVGDVVAVIALAPALIVLVCWLAEVTPESARALLRRLPDVLTPLRVLQLVSIPIALAISKELAPTIGFFAYALCFLPLGWIALEH